METSIFAEYELEANGKFEFIFRFVKCEQKRKKITATRIVNGNFTTYIFPSCFMFNTHPRLTVSVHALV